MNRAVNKIFFFFMITIILITSFNQSRSFAAPGEQPKSAPVTIILLDRFSFTRLSNWMEQSEAFHKWVSQSDLGAMTLRTASGRSLPNQLLTLSTGVKNQGTFSLLKTIQTDVSAQVFLPAYTNWISRYENTNQTILGEELKKFELTVAVVGNTDSNESMRRLAPLLVTDRNGRVPFGVVDSTFTEHERMKNAIKQMDADLIVVELGDLFREPNIESVDKQLIEMILWIAAQQGGHREIWLLSPSVDVAANKRMEWMTPIIRHQLNQGNGGVLVSPTTRQLGIVANVDFLPTMLDHWKLPIPIELEGRKLSGMYGEKLQENLFSEIKKIFYIHQTRPQLLYQVVSIQIILMLSTLILTYLTFSRRKWVSIVGHYALIYVLIIPFLLLLLGGLSPLWNIWLIHLYLVLGGLLTGFILRKRSRLQIYITISLIYVFSLLVDGSLGNPFMKRSFLGYDPVIGARYYGIGNEYMGVLICSALLLIYLVFGNLGRLKEEHRGIFIVSLATFLFLILLYFGLPNGGTKAGGIISWLIAMLIVSHSFFPDIWKGKRTIYISLGFVGLLILVLYIQFYQSNGTATHIGKLLHQIVESGPVAMKEIIIRKLEMNIRLIQVSSWSKLFVTSLVVLAWFLLRPKKRWRRSLAEPTIWGKAFRAIFVVSLVNLMINDSGVVAAAIGLLFAAVPLLHLVLNDRFKASQAP